MSSDSPNQPPGWFGGWGWGSTNQPSQTTDTSTPSPQLSSSSPPTTPRTSNQKMTTYGNSHSDGTPNNADLVNLQDMIDMGIDVTSNPAFSATAKDGKLTRQQFDDIISQEIESLDFDLPYKKLWRDDQLQQNQHRASTSKAKSNMAMDKEFEQYDKQLNTLFSQSKDQMNDFGLDYDDDKNAFSTDFSESDQDDSLEQTRRLFDRDRKMLNKHALEDNDDDIMSMFKEMNHRNSPFLDALSPSGSSKQEQLDSERITRIKRDLLGSDFDDDKPNTLNKPPLLNKAPQIPPPKQRVVDNRNDSEYDNRRDENRNRPNNNTRYKEEDRYDDRDNRRDDDRRDYRRDNDHRDYRRDDDRRDYRRDDDRRDDRRLDGRNNNDDRYDSRDYRRGNNYDDRYDDRRSNDRYESRRSNDRHSNARYDDDRHDDRYDDRSRHYDRYDDRTQRDDDYTDGFDRSDYRSPKGNKYLEDADDVYDDNKEYFNRIGKGNYTESAEDMHRFVKEQLSDLDSSNPAAFLSKQGLGNSFSPTPKQAEELHLLKELMGSNDDSRFDKLDQYMSKNDPTTVFKSQRDKISSHNEPLDFLSDSAIEKMLPKNKFIAYDDFQGKKDKTDKNDPSAILDDLDKGFDRLQSGVQKMVKADPELANTNEYKRLNNFFTGDPKNPSKPGVNSLNFDDFFDEQTQGLGLVPPELKNTVPDIDRSMESHFDALIDEYQNGNLQNNPEASRKRFEQDDVQRKSAFLDKMLEIDAEGEKSMSELRRLVRDSEHLVANEEELERIRALNDTSSSPLSFTTGGGRVSPAEKKSAPRQARYGPTLTTEDYKRGDLDSLLAKEEYENSLPPALRSSARPPSPTEEALQQIQIKIAELDAKTKQHDEMMRQEREAIEALKNPPKPARAPDNRQDVRYKEDRTSNDRSSIQPVKEQTPSREQRLRQKQREESMRQLELAHSRIEKSRLTKDRQKAQISAQNVDDPVQKQKILSKYFDDDEVDAIISGQDDIVSQHDKQVLNSISPDKSTQEFRQRLAQTLEEEDENTLRAQNMSKTNPPRNYIKGYDDQDVIYARDESKRQHLKSLRDGSYEYENNNSSKRTGNSRYTDHLDSDESFTYRPSNLKKSGPFIYDNDMTDDDDQYAFNNRNISSVSGRRGSNYDEIDEYDYNPDDLNGRKKREAQWELNDKWAQKREAEYRHKLENDLPDEDDELSSPLEQLRLLQKSFDALDEQQMQHGLALETQLEQALEDNKKTPQQLSQEYTTEAIYSKFAADRQINQQRQTALADKFESQVSTIKNQRRADIYDKLLDPEVIMDYMSPDSIEAMLNKEVEGLDLSILTDDDLAEVDNIAPLAPIPEHLLLEARHRKHQLALEEARKRHEAEQESLQQQSTGGFFGFFANTKQTLEEFDPKMLQKRTEIWPENDYIQETREGLTYEKSVWICLNLDAHSYYDISNDFVDRYQWVLRQIKINNVPKEDLEISLVRRYSLAYDSYLRRSGQGLPPRLLRQKYNDWYDVPTAYREPQYYIPETPGVKTLMSIRVMDVPDSLTDQESNTKTVKSKVIDRETIYASLPQYNYATQRPNVPKHYTSRVSTLNILMEGRERSTQERFRDRQEELMKTDSSIVFTPYRRYEHVSEKWTNERYYRFALLGTVNRKDSDLDNISADDQARIEASSREPDFDFEQYDEKGKIILADHKTALDSLFGNASLDDDDEGFTPEQLREIFGERDPLSLNEEELDFYIDRFLREQALVAELQELRSVGPDGKPSPLPKSYNRWLDENEELDKYLNIDSPSSDNVWNPNDEDLSRVDAEIDRLVHMAEKASLKRLEKGSKHYNNDTRPADPEDTLRVLYELGLGEETGKPRPSRPLLG